MKSYEIWSHPRTGAVYAFQIEDGRVTGCRGPLTTREMCAGDLTTLPYEGLPELVRPFGDSIEPFFLIREWQLAEQSRLRTGRRGNALARALKRVAARRRVRH